MRRGWIKSAGLSWELRNGSRRISMSTEKTPTGMAAYLSVMRPDHWLKNIFILFGHGAAVVLLGLVITPHLVWLIVYSLVPACLVASAN